MPRKKEKEKLCCVCLTESTKLLHLTDQGEDQVNYVTKLSSCIPEIKWDKLFLICSFCVELLDTAYTLRKNCLATEDTRVKLLSNEKKTTTTKELRKRRTRKDRQSREKVKEESVDVSDNEKPVVNNEQPLYYSILESVKDETEQEHKNNVKNEEIKNEGDTNNIDTEEKKCETDFNILTELTGDMDIDSSDDTANDNADHDDSDSDYDENKSLSELVKKQRKKRAVTREARKTVSPKQKMKRGPRTKRTKKDPPPKKEPRPRKSPLQLGCDKCPFTSPERPILVEHCALMHGMKPVEVKPYRCDLCQGKFTTYVNLYQHKKIHENMRTQVCTFCGKGFNQKSDLVTHEKRHMNKKDVHCEECGKSFNTYKDLASHKYVVHTDPSVWKFECEICQKRFPIKSNYSLHVKRHAGEKNFECHLCHKKFTEKSEVQRHMKSHSNERNYICSVCNKEYRDERNMKRHMAKAHLIGVGEIKIPVRVRRHQCHICTKAFYDKNKLVRHLYVHTGEKPFACSICNKAFNDRSYLKQHLMKNHGVEQDSGLAANPPRLNLAPLQYPTLGLNFGAGAGSTSRLN